jgi:hypothetical protein
MILDPEAIRFGNGFVIGIHGLAASPLRASFMPDEPNGSFQ